MNWQLQRKKNMKKHVWNCSITSFQHISSKNVLNSSRAAPGSLTTTRSCCRALPWASCNSCIGWSRLAAWTTGAAGNDASFRGCRASVQRPCPIRSSFRTAAATATGHRTDGPAVQVRCSVRRWALTAYWSPTTLQSLRQSHMVLPPIKMPHTKHCSPVSTSIWWPAFCYAGELAKLVKEEHDSGVTVDESVLRIYS